MRQEGGQYIKMPSSLSGVRLVFSKLPNLNILRIGSEKPYYTENTNFNLSTDVQLLHTVPSKLTIITEYEHQ